jgi:hypothetical protein
MSYELWDAGSGNRLGTFPTVEDAIEVVRDMARLNGAGIVEDLYLERLEPGEARVVLAGEELAARAVRAAAG